MPLMSVLLLQLTFPSADQSAQTPPANDSRYFEDHPFLQQYACTIHKPTNTVFCLKCQTCLSQKNLVDHFQSTLAHKKQAASFNTQEVEEFFVTTNVSRTLPDYRTEGVKDMLDGLTLSRGYRCPECTLVWGTRTPLANHFRDSHPGQPKPATWTRVYVQRLGPALPYFQVLEPGIKAAIKHRNDWVRGLLSQVESFDPSSYVLKNSPDSRQVAQFLLHVPWLAELKDVDKEALSMMGRVVNDKECFGIRAKTRHYFAGLMDTICGFHDEARKILNNPTPAHTYVRLVQPDIDHLADTFLRSVQHKPFGRFQNDKETRDTYADYIATFLWRLINQSPSFDFQLQPHGRQLADNLLSIISIEGVNQYELADAFHGLFYHLFTVEYWPSIAKPVPDPIERYIMATALNADGKINHTDHITQPLAKMTWLGRVVQGKQMDILMTENQATDPIHAAHLVQKYITEGHATSFSRIRSLQHMASTDASNNPGIPKFVWANKDRSALFYEGHLVSLDDLREVIDQCGKEMQETMKELMLGMEDDLELTSVHDSPREKEVGYMFLHHPQNHRMASHSNDLPKHIASNPALTSTFTVVDPNDPKKRIWNVSAMKSYLMDVAKFLAPLLTRLELNSGSLARGSELTGIQICNTAAQPMRNIHFYCLIMILTRIYNKMNAASSKQNLIPSAVDSGAADILTRYLVYIRPFAIYCASHVFADSPDIICLYRDSLFVKFDRLFTTDDLSKHMSSLTRTVNGFGMTASSARQILKAFRTVWTPDLDYELLGGPPAASANAFSAGHSVTTDRIHYGVFEDDIPGLAADRQDILMEMCKRWHELMGTRPAGILEHHSKSLLRQPIPSHLQTRPGPVPDQLHVLHQAQERLSEQLQELQTSHSEVKTLLQSIQRSFRTSTVHSSPTPGKSSSTPLLTSASANNLPGTASTFTRDLELVTSEIGQGTPAWMRLLVFSSANNLTQELRAMIPH